MNVFPCLTEVLVSLEDKADEIKVNIKQTITSYVDLLHGKIIQHFSIEETKTFEWPRNPFATDVTKLSLCKKNNSLNDVTEPSKIISGSEII